MQYIRQNIPQRGEDIGEFLEQLPGCQCTGLSCTNDTQCSCIAQFGTAYEGDQSGKTRRLNAVYFEQNDNVERPIIECNIYCFCQQTCFNRCVQHGIAFSLQIFCTLNKGLGVRTLDAIDKRSFVCEYAGEVLTFSEARRRAVCNTGSPWYLFALREHIVGGDILCTYVDPTYYGNVGRFINHSCQPNLLMVPVRANNLVPHLAFFALRDLLPGEELTYDYSGMDVVVQQKLATSVCNSRNAESLQQSNSTLHLNSAVDNKVEVALDTDCAELEQLSQVHTRTLCYCGEPVCRKYLPFDARLFNV